MITPTNNAEFSELTNETISDASPPRFSIVIADDEKRLLDLLAKNCQILGHRVVGVARNGEDAVKLAHELQPDLVILDINMPGMDGIEAAATILKKRKVPIIISTGNSDEITLRRAGHLDIGGYLVKPFSPAQLNAAFHMAVSTVPKPGLK